MLFNKKKIVVCFAVAASLLVGCQTAQKKTVVTDASLEVPEIYFDSHASRSIASGGPIAELFDILNKAKSGKSKITESIRVLNASNDAEVAAFKKTHGEITEKNAGELGQDLQKRFVNELLSRKSMQYLMVGSEQGAKDLRNLRLTVASTLEKGGKGAVEDVKSTATFTRKSGLLSAGEKEKIYSQQVYDKAYLVNLKKDVIAKDKGGFYATEKGNAVLDRILQKGKEFHMTTGDPVINTDLCLGILDEASGAKMVELLDSKISAAKKYGKAETLMKDGKPVLDANGKPITIYKLCPEVGAWVAASFQVGLGRLGASAWIAAEEMSVCGFTTASEGKACRGLAQEHGGEVMSEPARCK